MKLTTITSSTTQHWDRYRLKGAYYHKETDANWVQLKRYAEEGEPLILRRQPENRYDSGAIEVLLDSRSRVGWVPKESNKQLGILMDYAKVEVTAVIDPKSNFTENWIFMDVYVTFKDTHNCTPESEYEKLKRHVADALKPVPLGI